MKALTSSARGSKTLCSKGLVLREGLGNLRGSSTENKTSGQLPSYYSRLSCPQPLIISAGEGKIHEWTLVGPEPESGLGDCGDNRRISLFSFFPFVHALMQRDPYVGSVNALLQARAHTHGRSNAATSILVLCPYSIWIRTCANTTAKASNFLTSWKLWTLSLQDP